MKILCISDEIDPLIYSNSVKERFKDVDIILAAGDLPLSYYGFIVSSLNKPLLFVFGNHKLSKIGLYKKEYTNRFFSEVISTETLQGFGGTYIGGKIVKIKGLLVGGLGGSMMYSRDNNQYTDFGMRVYMLRMLPRLLFNRIFHGRYIDILLTHAPPRDLGDKPDLCHRGFKAFLTFMKRYRPRYLIHGHIHLYDSNAKRTLQYEDTTVVNAFKHTIIETAGKR